MKLNKTLLPIKVHYFLRFAATSSLGLFLPQIIREKGVPPQGIGLLWTICPFVTLVTSSFAGGIADAFKLHKIMFLTCLGLVTSGTLTIYFIPPMSQASVNGSLVESLSPIPQEEDDTNLVVIMNQWQFWLVCFCALVQYVGLNTGIVFETSACFKLLGTKPQNFGKQLMWGTIGMGLLSPIIGALVDWYSRGLPHKDYLPAFLICFFFMILDIGAVSKMSLSFKAEEKINFKQVGSVLKSFKSILFLLTVVMFGFFVGILWTYRLMLIEDTTKEFDPNFTSLKLLQGINMCAETFLGELPFLFLSGAIIQRLGYEISFLFCLLSASLRFFLYYTISNPWMLIPVEILNGPTHGLFFSLVVAYGNKLAPPGALATVQAIIRASIALGQASGGFLGGLFYHKYGGRMTFLLSSVIVGVFTLFFGVCQVLYRIVQVPKDKQSNCEVEVMCSSKLLKGDMQETSAPNGDLQETSEPNGYLTQVVSKNTQTKLS